MDTGLSDQFYRIQAVDRARKIPSVNYLWDKSTEVYERVKGTNTFVNWAFDTVESVVNTMIEKSLPVARLMEKPIYTLDKTLCQGIDFVEVNLPIIKEEPKQILNLTKSIVSERLRPAVKTFIDLKQETKQRVRVMTLLTYYKVHYLRIYSWQQADRVMSTETGISILKTVDNTTDFAEVMLDKYLPPLEEETHTDTERLCSEHVKLHHTMERLSEFSTRAYRRIYYTLMERLQHMYKIEILILVLHVLVVIQAIKFLESVDELWQKLSLILNTAAYGPRKSVKEWARTWRDWMYNILKKVAQHKNYITSTNGGSPKHLYLTATEKTLIEFLTTDASGLTRITEE